MDCHTRLVQHPNSWCVQRFWTTAGIMRMFKPVFVLAAVLLCGCSSDRFRNGHGDVGQFILEKAIVSGATPIFTNAVLSASGHWRYFEDQQGVVIHMAPADYPAVESFLLQTLGQPKLGPKDTPS